jgi:hypothetical protein
MERGLNRVYVDATKEISFPSTIPVFEFGKELAQVIPKLKIAAVPPQNLGDIMKFLENVA